MKKLRRLMKNKIISTIIGIFTFVLLALFLPLQSQAKMYYYKVLNEIVCFEADAEVTGVYIDNGVVYAILIDGDVIVVDSVNATVDTILPYARIE